MQVIFNNRVMVFLVVFLGYFFKYNILFLYFYVQLSLSNKGYNDMLQVFLYEVLIYFKILIFFDVYKK